MYNVSKYTDAELYNILDLNNPSDRELEAKIMAMIQKYESIGNESSRQLVRFFNDIYNRFFETNAEDDDDDDQVEGMANIDTTDNVPDKYKNPDPNKVLDAKDVLLTRPLAYSSDKLNPLLSQTIKRVISIDSQYRDNTSITPPTHFTFNLSEPLKDVVSLKLYSVQIPYTWYTINGNFGGNFFYLKGNAPGIDNGNHDYKVSIPSGTYSPENLVLALNGSITQLAKINPDVNFGQTSIQYSGVSAKATIQVDITKIYNESNYYLSFPNWISPVDPSHNRRDSLPGFLGYNNESYAGSAIISDFIYYPTTTDINKTFDVYSSNSTFRIRPYVGNSYATRTNKTEYPAISISLSGTYNNTTATSMSRSQIVSALNTALITNPSLDPNYSGIEWIDVSNPKQFNYLNSYMKMKIKVLPVAQQIIPNLKMAIVFDTDSQSLFCGPNSAFAFDSSICELSNIAAEVALAESSYTISTGDALNFICTASGYINSNSNYSVTITPPGVYSLSSYLSKINEAIQNSTSQIHGATNAQTSISLKPSTGVVSMTVSVNTTFTNSSYLIDGSGTNVKDLFMLDSSSVDLSNTNVFSNSTYFFTTLSFNLQDALIIKPKESTGITANAFRIGLYDGVSYASISTLMAYLNRTIQQYKTDDGRFPFTNSNVTYESGRGFVLTINVSLTLTQNDYRLDMYSVNNNWKTELGFDTSGGSVDPSNISFTLSRYKGDQPTYAYIESDKKFNDNTITVNDSSNNNVIELIPYPNVDGLNPTTKDYHIKITLSDGTYTSNDIINLINQGFNANSFTAGSRIFTTYRNNNLTDEYVVIRLNINKVFTTSNYMISFYDPVSFVKCFSNTLNASSGTQQNATWDTTVGWILGFRTHTVYVLSDYVSAAPTELVYYMESSGNICKLIGDTSVNTNLYSYFLITLDDYVQNHLNDGLITITNQETVIVPPPVIFICDPVTKNQIPVPADYYSRTPPYTSRQLYSFTQQYYSQNAASKSISNGPYVKDIFGIVPMKVSGLSVGSVYVEFGGTLQIQERIYFGPVNIQRMTIKLLTDRGDLVDLNNANWSFSLICEQLYKST